MTTNKIVNILGGGLLCAAILLSLLWTAYNPNFFGAPHLTTWLKFEIGTAVLASILFLFAGFLLSIVTPNEYIERFYLRYGIFFGILNVVLTAGIATWDWYNISMRSMPVAGANYEFPTLPEVLFSNLVADATILIATAVISSIGYGIGNLVKGLFKPSRT